MELAWSCWKVWEPTAGAVVGVLAKKKTVLTAARWVRGMWVTPADPKLRTGRGVAIPMIPMDEAYKHLGIWRRADGITTTAIEHIKERFRPALRRLSRLRKPTLEEFMVCSEGLLGSLGGFYFQTVYFPLEETDKIEASWRRIFNRKFGRDPSSARIELYEQAQAGPDGKKGVARVHLAAQAMASLVTAVSRAMADVPPTSQRSTARSMVALSMERLGCSQDPNWWDCSHVTAALEEKLRLAKSKHLGDAFIYCLNRIEGVALDEVSTRASEVEVESARRSALWRWTFGEPLTRGDPLFGAAPHFGGSSSPLLFEPVMNGGLGLEVELTLLEAGVRALGHMCKPPLIFTKQQGEWMEASEVGGRNVRWTDSKAARASWNRVLESLKRSGVQPVRPEQVRDGSARGGALELGSVSRCRADKGALEAALEALRAEATGGERSSRAVWRRRFLSVWPGVRPRAASEWQ